VEEDRKRIYGDRFTHDLILRSVPLNILEPLLLRSPAAPVLADLSWALLGHCVDRVRQCMER
jgi:hypothetical protein